MASGVSTFFAPVSPSTVEGHSILSARYATACLAAIMMSGGCTGLMAVLLSRAMFPALQFLLHPGEPTIFTLSFFGRSKGPITFIRHVLAVARPLECGCDDLPSI